MTTPPGNRVQMIMSYAMFFTLGIIVGASVFLLYFGQQLDDKIKRIDTLEFEKEQLKEEAERLTSELEKKNEGSKEMVVQEVEILINDSGKEKMDEVLRLEILKKAKRDVEFLKDKPLEIVSELHDSVRNIFRDKQYVVDEQTVTVNFEAISIYKTVRIWLHAKIEK